MKNNRVTVYWIYCLLILLILIISRIAHWLAWVSVYESCKALSCGSTPVDYPLVNEEIIWTQEMENKRLESLKPKKVVKITSKEVKAQKVFKEVKEWKIILTDKIQLVACLNQNDMKIHKVKNGNCFLWNGGKWKNIMIPPKSHIEHFKKTFWDDYKYRLAIANYEWSFDENAQNPYAVGYLQTLRSHKVKKDIVSQLTWLKNREDKNTGIACDRYLRENYTLFWTMNIPASKIAKQTCMARRHYGAFSPGDPKTRKHWLHSVIYAKRYKATTDFYLSLDF